MTPPYMPVPPDVTTGSREKRARCRVLAGIAGWREHAHARGEGFLPAGRGRVETAMPASNSHRPERLIAITTASNPTCSGKRPPSTSPPSQPNSRASRSAPRVRARDASARNSGDAGRRLSALGIPNRHLGAMPPRRYARVFGDTASALPRDPSRRSGRAVTCAIRARCSRSRARLPMARRATRSSVLPGRATRAERPARGREGGDEHRDDLQHCRDDGRDPRSGKRRPVAS